MLTSMTENDITTLGTCLTTNDKVTPGTYMTANYIIDGSTKQKQNNPYFHLTLLLI